MFCACALPTRLLTLLASAVVCPRLCLASDVMRMCSTEDAGRTCAVFGAFEGVAVATAVIAAARAVGLPPPTVLTLALAVVCGLAVAMFVRDYVRFRVYAEHYSHERAREKWCVLRGACPAPVAALRRRSGNDVCPCVWLVARGGCVCVAGSWHRTLRVKSKRWLSCTRNWVCRAKTRTWSSGRCPSGCPYTRLCCRRTCCGCSD